MSLPNVTEVYMIAVVSIFGPAVTALREVFNNILPHVPTFLLHYSLIVFLPHSFLLLRPSIGMTHIFAYRWPATVSEGIKRHGNHWAPCFQPVNLQRLRGYVVSRSLSNPMNSCRLISNFYFL